VGRTKRFCSVRGGSGEPGGEKLDKGAEIRTWGKR